LGQHSELGQKKFPEEHGSKGSAVSPSLLCRLATVFSALMLLLGTISWPLSPSQAVARGLWCWVAHKRCPKAMPKRSGKGEGGQCT
jgi:hypothetical protein